MWGDAMAWYSTVAKKLNSPHSVCVASVAQLYSLVYIISSIIGNDFILRCCGDREHLIGIRSLCCFNGIYLSCFM